MSMSPDEQTRVLSLFGEAFAAMLKKKGFSYRRLADQMKIHYGKVARWAKGRSRMSLAQLDLACNVMSLSDSERMELIAFGQHSVSHRLDRIKAILIEFESEALDFIAYVDKKELEFAVPDDFSRRIIGITCDKPDKQMMDFAKFARKISKIVDFIDEEIIELEQGKITRLVIDPPKGGLFFHRVIDDAYVFASTTNQDRMEDGSAYERVCAVAERLEAFMKTGDRDNK